MFNKKKMSRFFKKFRSIFEFFMIFSQIWVKKSKFARKFLKIHFFLANTSFYILKNTSTHQFVAYERVFASLWTAFSLFLTCVKHLLTTHILHTFAKWTLDFERVVLASKAFLPQLSVHSCVIYSWQQKSHQFLLSYESQKMSVREKIGTTWQKLLFMW